MQNTETNLHIYRTHHRHTVHLHCDHPDNLMVDEVDREHMPPTINVNRDRNSMLVSFPANGGTASVATANTDLRTRVLRIAKS